MLTTDEVNDIVNTALVKCVPKGTPIVFKNIPYTPDVKTPYLKMSLFLGETYAITIGPEGHEQTDGFVQVEIRSPLGSGTSFQNATLDKLRKAFKIGTDLSPIADHVIKIKSQQRSTGGQTTQSDYTRGAVEDNWDVNFFTAMIYIREPKQ